MGPSGLRLANFHLRASTDLISGLSSLILHFPAPPLAGFLISRTSLPTALCKKIVNFCISMLLRQGTRCLAVPVLHAYVCTILNQQLHNLLVATRCCTMQRCATCGFGSSVYIRFPKY